MLQGMRGDKRRRVRFLPGVAFLLVACGSGTRGAQPKARPAPGRSPVLWWLDHAHRATCASGRLSVDYPSEFGADLEVVELSCDPGGGRLMATAWDAKHEPVLVEYPFDIAAVGSVWTKSLALVHEQSCITRAQAVAGARLPHSAHLITFAVDRDLLVCTAGPRWHAVIEEMHKAAATTTARYPIPPPDVDCCQDELPRRATCTCW